MSRVDVFPYRTAGEVLNLSCACPMDGVEIGPRSVNIVDVPPDTSFELAVQVSGPEELLERVLPTSELESAPVRLVVVFQSISSRARRAIQLHPDGDHAWTGLIPLNKRDLFGSGDLVPYLIRSEDGGAAGYAEHAAAMLAWGPSIKLEIDHIDELSGDYLDGAWVSFKDEPALEDRADLLYALDMSEELPRLLMNEDHERFKNIMSTKGHRGGDVRVRNAVSDTIASQAWTSLLMTIMGQLAAALAGDPEHDHETALESLDEWQSRVLNGWVLRLFPGASREDAIEKLLTQLSGTDPFAEVIECINREVQRQARSLDAFRDLVRLRDGDGV